MSITYIFKCVGSKLKLGVCYIVHFNIENGYIDIRLDQSKFGLSNHTLSDWFVYFLAYDSREIGSRGHIVSTSWIDSPKHQT